MKDDPILADIRNVRDELSTRFGGDLSRMVAWLKQEEKKSGRKAMSPKSRKKTGPVQDS